VKTIFNIFPEGEKYDLLIEAGNDDLSLLFYDKHNRSVNGALLYEFTNPSPTGKEFHPDMENILLNNQSFINKAGTVLLLYNINEATLIPIEYYDGYANDDYLNLIYGNPAPSHIFSDTLEKEQLVHIYRVKNPIVNTLNKFFPQAKLCHSGSMQLQLFSQKADSIHCIVYNQRLKIIFYKNGHLQLMQYFAYGNAADMLYNLLNICSQHDVSPDAVELILYGLIDQNSHLYKEIYQYFLNVEMAALPEDILLNDEIKQNPAHFFAHLIIPALCE